MTRPERAGRPPAGLVFLALALVLVFSLTYALAVGAVSVPWSAVWQTLLLKLGIHSLGEPSALHRQVLDGIRLPRVAVAAWAGALLGLAGVWMQGAFRNPLAAPITTGASAGALLGASVGVALTATLATGPADPVLFSNASPMMVALAMLGAILAAALTVRLASVGGAIGAGPLLLAGLAINALIGAIAALFLFLGSVGAQTAATVIISWTFGGRLQGVTPGLGWPLAAATVLLGAGLLWQARELDVLQTGEDTAASLGVRIGTTRLLALVGAGAATGLAVAAAGVLAFVGLLAPLLARRILAPSHRGLTIGAPLLGASIVVLADAFGRTWAAPAELPAGVLIAAAGAPALLVLLRRHVLEGHA